MTYIITSNKPNLSATLHVTANCVLTIAGNNSVSNVAFSDEIFNSIISNGHWEFTTVKAVEAENKIKTKFGL